MLSECSAFRSQGQFTSPWRYELLSVLFFIFLVIAVIGGMSGSWPMGPRGPRDKPRDKEDR